MTGSKFRHRSARLTGLRLEMKPDEEVEEIGPSLPP
jgi:hypothetical protein